jgi:hypothetical protein
LLHELRRRPPGAGVRLSSAYLRVQRSAVAIAAPALSLLALLMGLVLWAVLGTSTSSPPPTASSSAHLSEDRAAGEGGVVREILIEKARVLAGSRSCVSMRASEPTRVRSARAGARRCNSAASMPSTDGVLRRLPDDAEDAYARAEAQFRANRAAYRTRAQSARRRADRKELCRDRGQTKLPDGADLPDDGGAVRHAQAGGFVSELISSKGGDHIERAGPEGRILLSACARASRSAAAAHR